VVENQIDKLIFDFSFSHNLCCKHSNGSCEPILDIYTLRAFQWYKKLFNLMGFPPFKWLFESLGVHRESNSQNGNPFGSMWAHSLTLPCISESINVIPGLHSRFTLFHALAFVISPRLGSWQIDLPQINYTMWSRCHTNLLILSSCFVYFITVLPISTCFCLSTYFYAYCFIFLFLATTNE